MSRGAHATPRDETVESTSDALASAALLLARAGRLEGASLLLGHVRANDIDFGFECTLGFRDEVLWLTDAEPDREVWLARGAGMSLDEAVTYAIEHLS